MARPALFITFLLLACTLHAGTPISFEHAMAAHEQGRHQAARLAFQRMAEAGLTEAQFNLGVMLLNGQGGSREIEQGAAWVLVAAEDDHSAAREAADTLASQLGDERMSQIQENANRLLELHGRQVLLERHRPVLVQPGESRSTSQPDNDDIVTDGYRIRIDGQPGRIHIPSPTYPRDAAGSGTMGEVRLGGWIGPDGSVEHPHVLSAHPEGVFERNALEAFSKLRTEWLEQPPAQARYVSQQITFNLDMLAPGSRDFGGGRTLRELRRAVEDGDEDLAAQHRVIWIIEQLAIPDLDPVDPETVIEITDRAARAGISEAQFDLGRRFLRGNEVERCKESAIFWFKQAAFEGHVEAAFELSRYSEVEESFRHDLRRSAIATGYIPAMLAEIRHQVENPEIANPAMISELIDQLPRRYRRNADDPILAEARRLAGE